MGNFGKYRRGAWKGECKDCGHQFTEGEEKYANLWDFPKKEFCKKCFWKAPQTGERFAKVEHKSFHQGGSSQRFDDDEPIR